MPYAAAHINAPNRVALHEGLIRVVKAVLKVSQDTTQRFRSLWVIVLLTVAVVLIGVGGGYAFGGSKSTYSPKQFRIILVVTRTIEVHGVIMFALGVGLFFSLGALMQGFSKNPIRLARIILALVTVYSFFCGYGFFTAYLLNHHYTAAMFWYVATAITSFALLVFTPPATVAKVNGDRA